MEELFMIKFLIEKEFKQLLRNSFLLWGTERNVY